MFHPTALATTRAAVEMAKDKGQLLQWMQIFAHYVGAVKKFVEKRLHHFRGCRYFKGDG